MTSLRMGNTIRATAVHVAVILTGVVVMAGCNETPTSPDFGAPPRASVDLSSDWILTSPSEVGFDAQRMKSALADAKTLPGIKSLLVVAKGQLIGEMYAASGGADSLYGVRSVTKSVLSLLTGLAIQKGAVSGTSEYLSVFFRPPLPVLDSAEQAITIQDLLSMTAGFQWNESVDFSLWKSSPNQLQFVLDRPLVAPPGTQFNYNSAAVHLLSAAIGKAAGTRIDTLADGLLFAPLGIVNRIWNLDKQDIPDGAAGLLLRPRDMAKLGELVLQLGWSGNRSIVPSSWILESTRVHVRVSNPLASLSLQYGDLWWIGQVDSYGVILAWGYGGQFILVIPALDLVAVTTSEWNVDAQTADTQEWAIMGFLLNRIYPLARPFIWSKEHSRRTTDAMRNQR